MTEAGTKESGVVKSSIGIGALLLDGIGDTIRVSLSADPVEEVYAGHRILRALGLESGFADVIACPTCGRCEWDCMALAEKVEKRAFSAKKRCKIAVMGCVVNGPARRRMRIWALRAGRAAASSSAKGARAESAERRRRTGIFEESGRIAEIMTETI